MRFFVIIRQGRLHYRSCVFALCAALVGCYPEVKVDPILVDPEPELPSLACSPFIATGYTDKVSYFPGEKVQVFFDAKQAVNLCRLDIYSINGDVVLSLGSEVPLSPVLPQDASENGFGFLPGAEFEMPEFKSGVYLVENKIPFIVKTREAVDVIVIYAANTANAYADSGGKSLYSSNDRPTVVSFRRPVPLQTLSQVCLKWFTSVQDLTFGYVADADMDFFESIQFAKVLVIAGHSEYWTREARRNFDRFVDSGGNALILSGNTMWWQVRYSDDRTQMYCYKDVNLDPISDPLFKTIEWSTPSLEYSILSSVGAHFPLGGYGKRNDQGWNGYKIVNPSSPLFEGLTLEKGDIISLPSLEYDGAPLSGYDEEGYPILDRAALGFEKIELLGFDKGFRVTETTATFIVFRKSSNSGLVINTGTTDWCSTGGMGGSSGQAVKVITRNALVKLVDGDAVFTDE